MAYRGTSEQLKNEIGRMAESKGQSYTGRCVLAAALERIEQLERESAEARQREEDAVSQHDTLRDQRDAERALAADRLELINIYRKARGAW